jgi:hypothetical protein
MYRKNFFLIDTIGSLNYSVINKFFLFEALVMDFEYKYKFTTLNLRAKVVRLNEIYLHIDFGLKNIVKLNSKEVYNKSEYLKVRTFDRFFVLTSKLEIFYTDNPVFAYVFA